MKLPFRSGESAKKVNGPNDQMTLFEHLAELRSRIIRSALAVVIGIIVRGYGPGWCRGLHRGRHWAPGIGFHAGRHYGLFRC